MLNAGRRPHPKKSLVNFCMRCKPILCHVATCVFYIAVRFPGAYIGWPNQGLQIICITEDPRRNGMCKCIFTMFFKILKNLHSIKMFNKVLRYHSGRRLIGSRIIESAAYCDQILLVPLHLYSLQTTLVIESFGYCYHFYVCSKRFY